MSSCLPPIKPTTLKELQLYVFADFERFMRYGFKVLGMDLASHHLAFAKAMTAGDRTVVVLQPRGAGKTLEGCLYCLFRAARRPSCRIRILASNATFAEKIGKQIIHFANVIPATRFLMPAKRTSFKKFNWGPNNVYEKDFCIECAGGDSTTNTGSHAELVWADDLEADDSGKNPIQREKLIDCLGECIPIINSPLIRYPKGKNNQDMVERLITGTPWLRQSIYKIPTGSEPHPLKGAKIVRCPALLPGNKSYWETKLPIEELLYRKNVLPPSQFELHYQQNTDYVDTKSALVKMDIVKAKSRELYKLWPQVPLTPSQRDPIIPNVRAYVDTSYGRDMWAMCLAGMCGGIIHILHVEGWHDPTEKAILKAIPLLRQYQVTELTLESNLPGTDGIEKVIANAMREHGLYIEIKRKHVSGSKDNRLCTWLVTPLNTGQAILHPRVYEPGSVLDQLSQYSDLGVKAMINDDLLDSMALANMQLSEDLYLHKQGDIPVSFQ